MKGLRRVTVMSPPKAAMRGHNSSQWVSTPPCMLGNPLRPVTTILMFVSTINESQNEDAYAYKSPSPLLLEQKEGAEEELPNTHLNISSIQDCMQVAIRYALLSIAYVQARKFIRHTPGLGLDHTLSFFNA